MTCKIQTIISSSVAILVAYFIVYLTEMPNSLPLLVFFIIFTFLIISLFTLKEQMTTKIPYFNIKIIILVGLLFFGSVGAIGVIFNKQYINYSPQVVLHTILLWTFAVFSFLLGFLISMLSRCYSLIPVPKANINSEKIWKLSFLFLVISLFTHLYLTKGRLFVGSLISGLYAIKPSTSDLLFTIENLCVPGSLIGYYYLKTTSNKYAKKFIIISLMILFLFIWGISGARSRVLAITFPIIAFEYLYNRRRSFNSKRGSGRKNFILLIILLLCIYFIGILRTTGLKTFNVKENFTENIFNPYYLTEPTGKCFELSIWIVNYFPKYHDYLHGYSLYSLLVTPILRKYWPNKPLSFGTLVAYYFQTGYFDLSLREYELITGWSVASTLVGEAYANFGDLGVITAFLALGMIAGIFHKICINNFENDLVIALYCLALPNFFMLVRGGFSHMTSIFMARFIPLYFMLLILSRFTKSKNTQ